jgi:hypothetical protein
MAHASGMGRDNQTIVPVIDFRRHSMVLEWHTLGGTWTAYDVPPQRVNGIAWIRPSLPNICLYAREGRLRLQIGTDQFELSQTAPRIRCSRGFASFGLRRRFTVESGSGEVLYSYAYWTRRGRDFFRWLATNAANPEWRATTGRQWSDGVLSAELRPS